MEGITIRDKIVANNKLIDTISTSTFVLNREVAAALEENKALRAICPHEYDELGYCIYCDSKKE